MRVLTTVFGYEGGTEIARRHLPHWCSVSDEVILVSPEDSPMLLPDTHVVLHGKSNKYGVACLDRQLFGMQYSARRSADVYVFLEYDALLLARPTLREGLQANGFRNKEAAFAAEWFFHFPWIFDANTLQRFVGEASLDPFEQGFVDRWLAAQVERMNLPVFNLLRSKEGFTRNTVRTVEEIEEAVQRASKGAYAFHGIKCPSVLDKITRAYRLAHLQPVAST